MNNKYVTMTVGAAVAIICLATILVPVISDAKHVGADVYPNGTAMGDLVGDRSIDIVLTNNQKIIVDGVEITGYNYEAILSDTLTVAVNASSVNVFWTAEGAGQWSAIGGANVHIDGVAKTIELTDITHASSNDNIAGDSLTIPYADFCYYRAPAGKYTEIRNATVTNYTVNDASQIYAAHFGSSTYVAWNGDNTYSNGVEGDSGIVLTPVDGDPEAYSIASITSGSFVPSWLVIPAKVYGEGSMGNEAHLLDVLPLLIIVAIMVSFVAIISRAKQ